MNFVESIHAGSCKQCSFQSAGGRTLQSDGKMAHTAVAWLMCHGNVTTASDTENWKVSLCFGLVVHELEVGHKTFAHGLNPFDM